MVLWNRDEMMDRKNNKGMAVGGSLLLNGQQAGQIWKMGRGGAWATSQTPIFSGDPELSDLGASFSSVAGSTPFRPW